MIGFDVCLAVVPEYAASACEAYLAFRERGAVLLVHE
jgi:hypothetical protein